MVFSFITRPEKNGILLPLLRFLNSKHNSLLSAVIWRSIITPLPTYLRKKIQLLTLTASANK